MRALGCLLLVAWLGCATGITTGGEGFAPLPTGSASGGGGHSSAKSSSSSSSSSSSGGAGGGISGSSGQGAGGGGAGGMPPQCVYDSPNQCASATQLPTIAGDKNSSTMITGQTSQWLKIKVEEQVSSIFPEDLSYTATLSWPASMAYDLYIQEGPKGGGPDCGAGVIQGQINGSSASVHSKWPDKQGLGGKDDSIWLCIEVHYVFGSDCGSGAEWTLNIQGHT